MDDPTPARWSHLRCLLLLIVVATGLRAWQLVNTEVATRDSIAFIRFAWRLEHEPPLHVLRTSQHPPGYPALIALVGVPLRAAYPDDLPLAMQMSAQLVSCCASVLLVVPMYFLGVTLFDRRVGFWTALLFQVLPSSGRMMPDGMTEPLFLLLAVTALLAGCRAVQTRHLGWFALTGLMSGFAYLTRAEGLLVGFVTGLVMLGLYARQRAWLALGRDGIVLIAATLLVAAPYMYAIRGLTPKPSFKNMLDTNQQASWVQAPIPLAAWNWGPEVTPADRYGWALRALASTINEGFFYVLTLPFLVGLVAFRSRLRENVALLIPLTLIVVLLALLYRLGQTNGYLGERHVVLVVMCGLYWAVAAVASFAKLLARLTPRLAPATLVTLLFVAISLAPLPRTLGRLHTGRAAFREAGHWLANNAGADVPIIDPFAYSTYYSGQLFTREGNSPEDPWIKIDNARQRGEKAYYVILEEGGKSQHTHLWYLIRPAKDLVRGREPVCRFKAKQGEVVVYRIPL